MIRHLLGFVLLVFLLPLSSQAQESGKGNVLFILDASGSMWGQVDQKPKIAIAKEVMTQLVQDLPAGIKAGLEVYGHRSKGDCNDIEVLVPIGAGDKPDLIKQIQALQPKGKTPITLALKQAAEQLRSLEDETSVVLVSDGKETCDGDPCTLVRELRQQGIKIKVHVVGFDVNQDEKEQLVCIAEAGGGRYFSADNTAQLQDALTEVKQEVVKATVAAPPPPPPPKPAAPTGETGVQFQTVLAPTGEIAKDQLSYQVFSGQQDLQGNRTKVDYSYDAKPLFKLAPGRYHLSVKYGDNASNAAGELDFEVKAGELTQQTINLNAGYLRLIAVPADGAEPLSKDMSYTVLSAKKDLEGNRAKVAYSYDAQPVFKLKTGKYLLQVKHGSNESNATLEVPVETQANELTEQTLNLDIGYLRLSAIPAEGADPLKTDMSYEMFTATQDLEGKRTKVAFSYDAQPVFKLKTGKYHLRINYGGNESNVVTEADVEVSAGELSEQTISLEAGYLRVSTLPAEGSEPLAKDLSYKVFDAQPSQQDDRRYVAFSYDAAPLFRLKEGRYRIEVTQSDKTASGEVEIKAGTSQETTLKLAP
ncbi:MAG: VWA domain-containing protein [Gammaproteobacteria bacterium]|nr:VWA domain-containing protein [Gammaproteobacteria bacterium]